MPGLGKDEAISIAAEPAQGIRPLRVHRYTAARPDQIYPGEEPKRH